MKAQGAVIQGALAVIGLVAAYATWQREPASKDDVTVLDLSKNEIELVRYDDTRHTVEIRRGTDNGNPVVWVREEIRDPPPAPIPDGGVADAGVASSSRADAGVAPAKSVTKTREYRGNDQ